MIQYKIQALHYPFHVDELTSIQNSVQVLQYTINIYGLRTRGIIQPKRNPHLNVTISLCTEWECLGMR